MIYGQSASALVLILSPGTVQGLVLGSSAVELSRHQSSHSSPTVATTEQRDRHRGLGEEGIGHIRKCEQDTVIKEENKLL